MTIQELIDYCESLPDKSAHVAFAEWNSDGHHFITPANLPHKPWKPFERHGRTYQVLVNWDNCLAEKVSQERMDRETTPD